MKKLMRISKFLSFLILVIGALALSVWALNAPENLPEGSQSKIWLDKENYSVTKLELVLDDNSRATPALGDFDGDNRRHLAGTIWMPESGQSQHPLLVFSHGFGSYHKGCRHIAEYLARNGYIVAAVNFPLSSMESPVAVPQLLDVANQPGDVSAVLDHLLSLNQDPESELHQRIDANRIGAYGLSLGGLTTALVSFHPDLLDPRIKASVMMAPPLEAFSSEFFAQNSSIKSLVISGSLDRVVPEIANAKEVQKRHPKGWFLSFDKGSHLGFANIGNPIRWMQNPDTLGCRFMDRMLSKLDLPERWDAVIPNTGGVLRDIVVQPPCPQIEGEALNGLKQQWLTRIAIGSFFDMHLRSGSNAESAGEFFTRILVDENREASLVLPR